MGEIAVHKPHILDVQVFKIYSGAKVVQKRNKNATESQNNSIFSTEQHLQNMLK